MNRAIILLSTVFAFASSMATVKFGAPFADGVVLQQGRSVPVWGWADPGEKVTVSFAGQTVSAVSDTTGKWRVDLQNLTACHQGGELVANGSVIHDVVVGEVWLASGQSNMEFPLTGDNPRFSDRIGRQVSQKTFRDDLRFVTIDERWSVSPRRDPKVVWRKCRPGNLAGVSAIAFWFGLDLRDTLGVPVGVIAAAEGATAIEAWIPPEGYARHPSLEHWGKWPVTAAWRDGMEDGAICGANQQPSVLWNGKFAGLTPYAVKGLIWYQGEHNARPGWALQYKEKMKALLDGFSEAFESPHLSFYYVLLAPYGWMDFSEVQREQKRFAEEEARAALVVVNDVGQIDEIHPHEKRTPAERLALHALHRDYGFDIQDNSPSLRTWYQDGTTVHLLFNDAKWLYVYTPNNSMNAGFEVLDEDGRWHTANLANLRTVKDWRGQDRQNGDFEGEGILLKPNEPVGQVVGVRYLHEKPYYGCIKNEADLPLAPFDTVKENIAQKKKGKAK